MCNGSCGVFRRRNRVIPSSQLSDLSVVTCYSTSVLYKSPRKRVVRENQARPLKRALTVKAQPFYWLRNYGT